MSESIEPIKNISPSSQGAGASQGVGNGLFDPGGKANLYNLIFYLLLEAMNTRQQTVYTQANELSSNANAQNKENTRDKGIKFHQLPDKPTNGQINQVQDENEKAAAQRENIQNDLITLRQNGQVLMTEANTNVNTLEQDASMDSGWLKSLNTIFQVIDQMTKNN